MYKPTKKINKFGFPRINFLEHLQHEFTLEEPAVVTPPRRPVKSARKQAGRPAAAPGAAMKIKYMCPTMRENYIRSTDRFELEQKFNQAIDVMAEEERKKFFEETARIATPSTYFEPPNLASTLRTLIDDLDATTIPNNAKKAISHCEPPNLASTLRTLIDDLDATTIPNNAKKAISHCEPPNLATLEARYDALANSKSKICGEKEQTVAEVEAENEAILVAKWTFAIKHR